MSEELRLKLATDATRAGPRFSGDRHKLVVEYDYDSRRLAEKWAAVEFEDVLQFECRNEVAWEEEDVVDDVSVVTVLRESERLRDLARRWPEAFIAQQLQGEPYRHFKLYFQHTGVVDVVAAKCRVL